MYIVRWPKSGNIGILSLAYHLWSMDSFQCRRLGRAIRFVNSRGGLFIHDVFCQFWRKTAAEFVPSKLRISDADARTASGLRQQLLEEADGILQLGSCPDRSYPQTLAILDVSSSELIFIFHHYSIILRYSVVLSNELLDEPHRLQNASRCKMQVLLVSPRGWSGVVSPEVWSSAFALVLARTSLSFPIDGLGMKSCHSCHGLRCWQCVRQDSV